MNVAGFEIPVTVNARHLVIRIRAETYLGEKVLEGRKEEQNASVMKPARAS